MAAVGRLDVARAQGPSPNLQRHHQRRAAQRAAARQHHRPRLRVDKGFTMFRTLRIRGLFDLFNITNSNAAETRTISTGTSFLRPTAVLPPRTARIGARVTW
jgi:hypothetical protein